MRSSTLSAQAQRPRLLHCLLLLLVLCLHTAVASPSPSPPSSLVSLPLLKRHGAAAAYRHRSRGHHLPRAKAFGSLFATYLATVTIAHQPFTCILDTGSSDFAVAASAECGCGIFYSGQCEDGEGAVHLQVRYGDGNWSGVACTDDVSINEMSLGSVTFAGMRQQSSMLECDSAHQQNGIIGLAFPGLLGPPANYTLPFFDLLTSHTGLPAVFALQCCGWQNDSEQEYNAEYAQGALDLGGVNRRHVRGQLFYTPIVERLFYAVDLIDIRVGGVSTMPTYRRPANAQYRRRERRQHGGGSSSSRGGASHLPVEETEEGQAEGANLRWAELPFPPQAIVDSGTSNLIFTPDIWNLTVQQLQSLVPQQPDAVWQGDECIHHSPDGRDLTATWPMLTLVLAGEEDAPPFALSIPPCRYLAKAPAKECRDGEPGHAFAIEQAADEGVILGQVVYESFYVVHDNEKNRVGFGRLQGCSSDAQCLQQVAVMRDDQLVRATPVGVALQAAAWTPQHEAEQDETAPLQGERSTGSLWLLGVGCLLLLVWLWGWRRWKAERQRDEEYRPIRSLDGDAESDVVSVYDSEPGQ